MSWKVIHDRQEWIIAIECINVIGVVILLLIIFKTKYTNTAWIPVNTPANWQFSTSNSSWTSNSYGYEWLIIIFEPLTRPIDCMQHCLLIMDGHSSHIIANVIAFCMQNVVNLFIMLPHCSHLLQSLDVGVFAPLKRALSKETDAVNQYDSSCISRISWVEMYIRARIKVFSTENLKAGWKRTGLIPLDSDKILSKLPNREESALN